MPEMEYNNLLYQISKRLDEMNVGEQLLVMCRGKVTVRSGEDFQTFSLFEELEQKGYLSPDHLILLKGMLKGVNEWALFDEVEQFETNRKEYKNLLEQSVRVLDEPNELERLVSICGEKITEESRGNVRDVRSLFKELESNDWLGIDCLDTVKEILTQTEKNELLKEVEEFELRRSRENKFRKRKGIFQHVYGSHFYPCFPQLNSVNICLAQLCFVFFVSAQAASFVSTVRDKLAGGKFSFVVSHVLVGLSLLIFMFELISGHEKILNIYSVAKLLLSLSLLLSFFSSIHLIRFQH